MNTAPINPAQSQPSSGHTPTPWTYRPREHDDWGWIRDADGNLAATARDGRVWSEHFDKYRDAGTDPYEPNAAFIVEAVNSHAALKSRIEELEAALRKIASLPNGQKSFGDIGVLAINVARAALEAKP
ncbi:MAG: hypothetical protein JWR80_10016 [Bradyrhizobium sp.]|nr:hypothetical protein [Bradyrhizobium sp.]